MIDSDLNMGQRRSLRLAGYDYSAPGMYFVTVCTEAKVALFGEIHGSGVKLNAAGDVVVGAWMEIPERFVGVQLDSFVVMPNHFHGVIFILSGGVGNTKSKDSDEGAASSAPTLGKIMRAFKSISAIRVNEVLGRKGRAVWQRNYFERIVRRGKDLDDVRRYIAENPERWGEDEENPEKR
jgi:REP element-mobilizing transposase RayT